MKFCKDCVHCKSSGGNMGFEECMSPKNVKSVDRVNGEIDRAYTYCASQRSGDWIDAYITKSCGKQARWFKPKSVS